MQYRQSRFSYFLLQLPVRWLDLPPHVEIRDKKGNLFRRSMGIILRADPLKQFFEPGAALSRGHLRFAEVSRSAACRLTCAARLEILGGHGATHFIPATLGTNLPQPPSHRCWPALA
jgi:hypothetical protein